MIFFDEQSKVVTFKVDSRIRASDGRLNVTILQTDRASEEQLKSDASRPANIAVLNDLLNGGGRHAAPVLREFAPGNVPAVIIAPEYAFGSCDWAAVDAAVRASTQPLVLIAGFGATKGKDVLDWAEAGDGTARKLSWDQEKHPISEVLLLNGGWCWIHGLAAQTICITYVKNHLEQTTEAQLPLASGQILLHLAFGDLDIFPMICADLVQSYADGEGTAIRRVQAFLEANPGTRPVFVVGSIYQIRQNDNWNTAIDHWLNVATVSRPALAALANVANCSYLPDEAVDKWRSLSGVYARFTDIPRNQRNLPAGRAIESQNVRGAVIRNTLPQLVGGPIAWGPYRPTGNLFVWHPNLSCALTRAGIQVPVVVPPPICQTEVVRFLHRHKPETSWSPRVSDGLRKLVTHLEACDRPTSQRLLRTFLQGLESRDLHDPDCLHEPVVAHSLRSAIFALAMVATSRDIVWQADDDVAGQLLLRSAELTILVWHDLRKTQRELMAELVRWKMMIGYHPPLVVLCDGPHGPPVEGVVRSSRRANFAEPPGSANELQVGGSLAASITDIATPQFERSVACVRLDTVNAIYSDYDAHAAKDEEDLDLLILRFRRFFDPKAA